MYWFSAYKGTTKSHISFFRFQSVFLQGLPYKITKPESLGFKKALIHWFYFP